MMHATFYGSEHAPGPPQLWDVNMESAPVASFKVHEHLRSKLCDLYENDSIFDKFECTLSGDGSRVATGSYR